MFLTVLSRARACLTAAASVALLCASGAQAQVSGQTPYEESGVFPGDEITNNVAFFDGINLMGEVEATFTVGHLPAGGTLRAFEPDYGFGGPAAVQQISFSGSAYSPSGALSGPFTDLANPGDYSTLTAGQAPVPVPSLQLRESAMIRQGVPLFFVIEDRSFNLRSDRPDHVVLTVVDYVTGDEEIIRLTETGNSTNLFSGWLETGARATERHDGFLSTVGNSRVDAWYLDQRDERNRLAASILVGPVDPRGVVFDSSTGDPISGLTLTLIDVSTGAPATVYGDDLVASFPATLVTGSSVSDGAGRAYSFEPGAFRFPYVPEGTYRFSLELPEGLEAPTALTDAQLAALGGDFTIAAGSRLEAFVVEPGPEPRVDIPVDVNRDGSVVRSASLSVAEVGELFEYQVQITSPHTYELDIVDVLPRSIRYVPGTLAINGTLIDPVLNDDGRGFVIEDFATRPGEALLMSYTAQVQMGADTAALYPSSTTISEHETGRMRLRATHDLRIRQAFDLDDIVILGQVVAGGCGPHDASRDMSGIRVLLETGDYAVTDEEGKFHFRDIPHRPRVVQLDTNTLPASAEPVLCRPDTRNAGSAISRFIDVRPGMMGRVEFYVQFDQAAEAADLSREMAEAEYVLPNPTAAYTEAWLARQGKVETPRVLTPSEGMLPISDTINIFTLRPSGGSVEVTVNGVEVSALSREPPMVNAEHRTVIDRFRAVRIEEGISRIHVRFLDEAGAVVAEETRTVRNATQVARSEVVASGSILESDGRTTPVVTLRLSDRNDIPVRPGTLVQFEIDEPFAFMPDIQRRSESAAARKPTRTTTVMVRDNGQVRLTLAPALETWTARIRTRSSDRDVETRVRISAAERPWVLVGLAEGTIAERQIRENMRRSGDIGNGLSGRIGFFAEGVIRGEWLLTLRYDSARDGKGEFSGIDPDRDYVVYGDRSWQDDASPSRFPLYLRLRKEGAEYLVGDFEARIDTNLVDINREVTGLRAVLEDEHWRVMAFAAETSQRYVEDRIALDGTMGPYQLSRSDIVSHSETVRLIEVSRIDNSREISSQTLTRGRDYIISSGRIHLRSPMPAFSPEFNRYVLVVDYETDEDVEDGLFAGVRAEVQVSERVRVGTTAIYARNVDGEAVTVRLIGGDVTFQVNEDFKLTAEAIEVRKTFASRATRGTQAELRAEYDDGASSFEGYLRSTRGPVGINANGDDQRTDTLGASMSMRLREGHNADGEVDNSLGLFLEGEVFAEKDHLKKERRTDAEMMLVSRTEEREFGVGFISRERKGGERDARALHFANHVKWDSADGRITWGLGLEYALDSKGYDSRDHLNFSIDWQASENLKIFSTWEGQMERGRGDMDGLLSFGAEYALAENSILRLGGANAYSRVHGSGQAAFFGLDHLHQLAGKTQLSFGLDVHRDMGAFDIPMGLSGSDNPLIDESFVAFRTGMRHTEETWSMGVDLQHRRADSGNRGNIRFSADGEINDQWSVGGDLMIGRSTEDINADREFDIRLSAAHRGNDRDPITLYMLEGSLDEERNRSNRKLMGSVHHSRYLTDSSHLNLRLALRNQNFRGTSGVSTSATTSFLGAEYRHDLSDKFDFGLHGSIMSGAASRATSSGLSFGLTPFENGWISLGYNFEGFDDDDFSVNGTTSQGAFIQMRMKFDQNTIKDMFR